MNFINKKLNNKGFSHLEIGITIAVVAVIAIVGVFVYKKSTDKSNAGSISDFGWNVFACAYRPKNPTYQDRGYVKYWYEVYPLDAKQRPLNIGDDIPYDQFHAKIELQTGLNVDTYNASRKIEYKERTVMYRDKNAWDRKTGKRIINRYVGNPIKVYTFYTSKYHSSKYSGWNTTPVKFYGVINGTTKYDPKYVIKAFSPKAKSDNSTIPNCK